VADQTNHHAIECWNLHVTGRVQGVSFRAYARREATRLGLAGYARNRSDASVEIVVEGSPTALDAFLAWCHRGSPHSRVEHVTVDIAPAIGIEGFTIG